MDAELRSLLCLVCSSSNGCKLAKWLRSEALRHYFLYTNRSLRFLLDWKPLGTVGVGVCAGSYGLVLRALLVEVEKWLARLVEYGH